MLKSTLVIISCLALLAKCDVKPIQKENGVWFPGKSCGIKTEIKYLSDMPTDTSNLACTFVYDTVYAKQPALVTMKECILQDFEYFGGTQLLQVAKKPNSPKECQQRCQEHSECEVWTYHNTWRWCRLRLNNGKIRERKSHVSGPKYCEV